MMVYALEESYKAIRIHKVSRHALTHSNLTTRSRSQKGTYAPALSLHEVQTNHTNQLFRSQTADWLGVAGIETARWASEELVMFYFLTWLQGTVTRVHSLCEVTAVYTLRICTLSNMFVICQEKVLKDGNYTV